MEECALLTSDPKETLHSLTLWRWQHHAVGTLFLSRKAAQQGQQQDDSPEHTARAAGESVADNEMFLCVRPQLQDLRLSIAAKGDVTNSSV